MANHDITKRIEEYALSGGWTKEKTNGGHIRFRHPVAGFVITAATPSDKRAYQNQLSRIRRAEREHGIVRVRKGS